MEKIGAFILNVLSSIRNSLSSRPSASSTTAANDIHHSLSSPHASSAARNSLSSARGGVSAKRSPLSAVRGAASSRSSGFHRFEDVTRGILSSTHPSSIDGSSVTAIHNYCRRGYNKNKPRTPPPTPKKCLWCGSDVESGPCSLNYCHQLHFDTLKEAMVYIGSESLYGCAEDGRRFISPRALELYYANEYKAVVANGKKCKCGAYTVTDEDLALHLSRRDDLRCAHRPSESSEVRKERIKSDGIKARQVLFELSKFGL